jgi:hypothetical protein
MLIIGHPENSSKQRRMMTGLRLLIAPQRIADPHTRRNAAVNTFFFRPSRGTPCAR